MVLAEFREVPGARTEGIWKVIIQSLDFTLSMIRSHWIHKSGQSCDTMFC